MDIIELRSQIRQCTKCELCKKMPDGNKPVPGIGPFNAKLIILGEALGRDESIMEEPFVGLCGQFLTKCLNQVGIKREECYITNCVKCRPTDNGKKNRPPTQNERDLCENWFYKELELIKPKFVLTLGKVALENIFKYKPKNMKDIVGQIFYNHDYKYHYLATYHPSYILVHGKKYTKQFIEHLNLASSFSQNL